MGSKSVSSRLSYLWCLRAGSPSVRIKAPERGLRGTCRAWASWPAALLPPHRKRKVRPSPPEQGEWSCWELLLPLQELSILLHPASCPGRQDLSTKFLLSGSQPLGSTSKRLGKGRSMWLGLFVILTSSRSQLLSGGPLYSYPPLVPSNSHGAPFATSP